MLGVDLGIVLSKQTKPKPEPNNFRAEETIEWLKKPVAKPDSVSLILETKGRRVPAPESGPLTSVCAGTCLPSSLLHK